MKHRIVIRRRAKEWVTFTSGQSVRSKSLEQLKARVTEQVRRNDPKAKIEWSVQSPLQAKALKAKTTTASAREWLALWQARQQDVVVALSHDGFTVRGIAELVGLEHARVHKILTAQKREVIRAGDEVDLRWPYGGTERLRVIGVTDKTATVEGARDQRWTVPLHHLKRSPPEGG